MLYVAIYYFFLEHQQEYKEIFNFETFLKNV